MQLYIIIFKICLNLWRMPSASKLNYYCPWEREKHVNIQVHVHLHHVDLRRRTFSSLDLYMYGKVSREQLFWSVVFFPCPLPWIDAHCPSDYDTCNALKWLLQGLGLLELGEWIAHVIAFDQSRLVVKLILVVKSHLPEPTRKQKASRGCTTHYM